MPPLFYSITACGIDRIGNYEKYYIFILHLTFSYLTNLNRLLSKPRRYAPILYSEQRLTMIKSRGITYYQLLWSYEVNIMQITLCEIIYSWGDYHR